MATNRLLPFANGTGANVTPFDEWSGDDYENVVENGFKSGIAKSAPMNRVWAQGATAGNVIGELVKNFAGKDADIDAADLYPKFVEALRQVAKTSVLDVVYPVGSIYISTSATSPATLFGVGIWERIGAGRCLIDAGGDFAPGSTGGAGTHSLTVNEMPAHNHVGSTDSAGAHAHEATADSAGTHQHWTNLSTGTAGGHNHTRGSMEITGGFRVWTRGNANGWGAFAMSDTSNPGLKGGSGGTEVTQNFNASRTWTGSTSWSGDHTHTVSGNVNSAGAHTHTVSMKNAGVHTHTVTVGYTGGSEAFSLRNPYLAVYMWKRTA